ncbi:efflux RND transporter periplasmic adaptor subunit [Phreatobacter aquaticus]|uniref:Efflux RND transporter periplasmic adaptor subunit n=1 Tax=Phreatobacter aquaticus TaxID=2570229 RepID=A0A4D7QJL3_9HYPH|nr:efflux RND transporter periplasmic adaptor subunit [Phreatobacter aquaticus]QCK85909.1 efflux RND transporter periplasmic adaptor subunit [Phreatobacter aquaticus]
MTRRSEHPARTGRSAASHPSHLIATLVALALSGGAAEAADFRLEPVTVTETKAVFARVETRFLIPARARIGGTLISLDVTEGSAVTAGQVVALVIDPKLALQMKASDARIAAVRSELANAQTEFERSQSLIARGAGTQQRVDQTRTQVDVLTNQLNAALADRSVIAQQTEEGQVLAPIAGRVLKVPVARGSVLLPGEPVAQVAGGGFFLRLALPERHAPLLREGSRVSVGERGNVDGAAVGSGRLVKLYPQIENGRVIADVEVETLGDFFVGERIPVHVPIATRQALAIPVGAVINRAGVDLVRLRRANGEHHEVAVVLGPGIETEGGPRVEVLTGLVAGDLVVTP